MAQIRTSQLDLWLSDNPFVIVPLSMHATAWARNQINNTIHHSA